MPKNVNVRWKKFKHLLKDNCFEKGNCYKHKYISVKFKRFLIIIVSFEVIALGQSISDVQSYRIYQTKKEKSYELLAYRDSLNVFLET